MAYTVFALRWRPNVFDEIIGQGHIVSTLENAIEKNRLAHAFIFAGPRGVGKTSTARILAKALNCKEGPTINPCQKCSCCREITQGRSFDVIEIDGASNRGIDEIRQLRENVKFPPASGKFKIYIIDEVHMLTTEAFNALLKTLEEPPEFVKFIFATTQPNKVIPTILSRCHRLDFRRIPVMETIAQLEKILKAEGIGAEPQALLAIAKASDGSLRDAESLLDEMVSFSSGQVTLSDVISVLGIVQQEVLFEITDSIIRKDPRKALALLNSSIDEGKDVSILLDSLIEHFRNLMVAKITNADPELIDLPQEICRSLFEQAGSFTLEEILGAFNTLVNAREMSKRLESIRVPLEISLVRLAHDKKALNSTVRQDQKDPVHIAQASQHPKHVTAEHKKEEAPSHQESKTDKLAQDTMQEHSDTESASITLDNIKEKWQKAIELLSQVKISAATYLSEGWPVKIDRNVLVISFPRNYSLHKESLERKENKAIIEKTFFELLKSHLRINFVLSKEEANKTEEQKSPFIQSALEAFKGRIIKEHLF